MFTRVRYQEIRGVKSKLLIGIKKQLGELSLKYEHNREVYKIIDHNRYMVYRLICEDLKKLNKLFDMLEKDLAETDQFDLDI